MKHAESFACGGFAAADDVMFVLTGHILQSEDTRREIVNAVEALQAGKPRPNIEFRNR
jgi:hypothetical protein